MRQDVSTKARGSARAHLWFNLKGRPSVATPPYAISSVLSDILIVDTTEEHITAKIIDDFKFVVLPERLRRPRIYM